MDAELIALALVAFLLTYAIHSTVLLSGAWLAARRLPLESAALRERIWKFALLGGFATAAVQMGLGLEPPLGRWALGSSTHGAEQAANAALAPSESSPTEVALAEAPAQVVDVAADTSPRSSPPVAREPRHAIAGRITRAHGPSVSEPEVLGADAAPAELPRVARVARPSFELPAANVPKSESSSGIASAPELPPAPPTRTTGQAGPSSGPSNESGDSTLALAHWPRLVAVAWVAALALVVALFARAWKRLQRGLSGKRQILRGPLVEMLARASRGSGMKRRVRLWVAPRLSAPLSFGILRPSICVPPRALRELSADEQESMLAHELAHLVRRDPLWRCICWVVETLFAFQPLNRIARRELQEVSELLCDDWAVRATGRKLSLASCLARIAGWIVGEPRPLLAAHLTTGECAGERACSRLGQRIERLLDERVVSHAQPRRQWFSACAGAALIALVLVVPGVSAVSSEDEPSVPRVELASVEPVLAPLPAPELAPEPAPALAPAPHDEPSPLESEVSATLDVEDPLATMREDESKDVPVIEDEPPVDDPFASAPTVPASLGGEIEALDVALSALEEEIAALESELEAIGLADGFRDGLDQLKQRAQALEGRRLRMKELVLQALLREVAAGASTEPRLEDRPVR